MIVERAYRQRFNVGRSRGLCSSPRPTLFESHRPAVIVEYLPKSHAVFLQRISHLHVHTSTQALGSRAEAKDGTPLPVAHA